MIRIGPECAVVGALTVSLRYSSPIAGNATAASVIAPLGPPWRRHNATCTAQSSGPGLGEFPRAVQRVDDPNPVGPQSGQVVVGLLAEHRVTRALSAQPPQQ